MVVGRTEWLFTDMQGDLCPRGGINKQDICDVGSRHMFRLEKYQQKQHGKLRPWETCRRRDHPGGVLGAPTLGLLGDDSQWGLRSSVSDFERESAGCGP